ncbi:MAG: hypothetical protein ACREEW_04680 [Caulobacteraceae bacterium]
MSHWLKPSLAGCVGKARFETAALAKAVARRRSRNGLKGEPYKCRCCGAWHIGTRKR